MKRTSCTFDPILDDGHCSLLSPGTNERPNKLCAPLTIDSKYSEFRQVPVCTRVTCLDDLHTSMKNQQQVPVG